MQMIIVDRFTDKETARLNLPEYEGAPHLAQTAAAKREYLQWLGGTRDPYTYAYRIETHAPTHDRT